MVDWDTGTDSELCRRDGSAHYQRETTRPAPVRSTSPRPEDARTPTERSRRRHRSQIRLQHNGQRLPSLQQSQDPARLHACQVLVSGPQHQQVHPPFLAISSLRYSDVRPLQYRA